jgi:TNF receptor-associated factor 4
MQNHLDNECSKQEIPCPFNDCGCDFRGHRANIAKHMKDAPGIHLNMTGKTISIQKNLLQLYEERTNEQKIWIELLARKVNALEKTYGAQYIWKIDHYQERLQEARTNKKTTLFSPPFLTSRHGYRLALSICLCGDGKGE